MSSLTSTHRNSAQFIPLLQRLNSAMECLPAAEKVKDSSPEAKALVAAAAAYSTELALMLKSPNDRSQDAVACFKATMQTMNEFVSKKGESCKASFRPRLVENGLRVMLSNPDAYLTVNNVVNAADAFIDSQVRAAGVERTLALMRIGIRRGCWL